MPYEFMPRHLADYFQQAANEMDRSADELEQKLLRVCATPARHTVTYPIERTQ